MSDLKSHLLEIREKRGKLTPRIVYEEAKSKDHPLHDRVFDVPAKEAAERYYIGNAAQLLRVTFRQTLDSGESADLRHFWVVRDKETGKSEYVPTEEVIMNPVSREIMLRTMLRDWKNFKNRYQSYTEFASMILSDPDLVPVDPDEEFAKNGSED